jgi:hypothetical protein
MLIVSSILRTIFGDEKGGRIFAALAVLVNVGLLVWAVDRNRWWFVALSICFIAAYGWRLLPKRVPRDP